MLSSVRPSVCHTGGSVKNNSLPAHARRAVPCPISGWFPSEATAHFAALIDNATRRLNGPHTRPAEPVTSATVLVPPHARRHT